MRRFSDFAKDEASLAGEKKKITEVLGHEIVVNAYRIAKSRAVPGKACLQLQFSFSEEDELFVLFTNSEVLIKQIEKYAEEMPFLAVIEKHGSYYTFT